jgi:hypothetical protein
MGILGGQYRKADSSVISRIYEGAPDNIALNTAYLLCLHGNEFGYDYLYQLYKFDISHPKWS